MQKNKFSLIVGAIVLFTLCNVSKANTEQMNSTLNRMNRILNQINPLINLAQQQQDPNARVKFQFDALRSDIASIQEGIEQATQRVSIQPRVITPLSGDYLPVPESVLKNEKPITSEDAAP